MKKVMIVIFVFLLILCCVGCEKKDKYEFLQEVSEIKSIEIVEMGAFEENAEVAPMSVISVVEKTDTFLSEFLEMNCFSAFGDPQGITEYSKVIKITYNDDEFELIGVGGQAEYTHERQYRNYVGYRYFDEAQFEALISKYCGHQSE